MTLDWRTDRARWVRTLDARTGKGLVDWNRRIRAGRFRDVRHLRIWLSKHGVTGYPQQLLVMERFGYPEHVLTSGPRLIADQYVDRPQLRPILDAVVKAAQACGPVVIQARKTFVALAAERCTFARVQPTTQNARGSRPPSRRSTRRRAPQLEP
jgi:hypothetical protein